MKKIKVLLPLLAILLMFALDMNVKAEPRIVKLEAGAETGKITFRVWDLQSLDGTVKVKALDGGEIHLESISAVTDNEKSTVIKECSKNKVCIVSDGTPLKTTITVNLSFVEDGTYKVTLTGGCTDKKGKYRANGLNEEQEILVGAANVEPEETNDTVSNPAPSTTQNNTSTASNKNNSVTKKENVEEDDMTIIRGSEEESERVVDSFFDETEEALKEVVKETEKEKKTVSSFGRILRIILLVLFIILLAVAAYLIYRYRKKRKQDYDGAPDIDYVIEEDD